MKNCVLIVSCFFFLTACIQKNSMKIKVLHKQALDEIPSASGIENVSGSFWVIGDNSPWLYKLDNTFNTLYKYKVFSDDSLENNVIPKHRKHDYEAMTVMQWDGDSVLFLFGSGSKAPFRFQGLKINLKDPGKYQEKFDLTGFYQRIMDEAKLDEEELNLEAATVLNERLLLFNRGKNKLISINLQEFQKFIRQENEHLKMKVYSIDLPSIDGINAGFSGATSDEKNDRIIFTASVENTADWVSDGAVLGSYVGVIEMGLLHNHFQPTCTLLTENEKPLLIKVESVAIQEVSTQKLNCILVTDSDGGQSELLEVELTF